MGFLITISESGIVTFVPAVPLVSGSQKGFYNDNS